MLTPELAKALEQKLFEYIDKNSPDDSIRKATRQMLVPLIVQAFVEYESLKLNTPESP